MSNLNVAIVGDVMVDVHHGLAEATRIRLGGVLHSARCLAAFSVPFACMALMPRWLKAPTRSEVEGLGGKLMVLGDVEGAPNVLLVGDPTEAGPQGYELLLRDEYQCRLFDVSRLFAREDLTDILLFPGQYDNGAVLEAVGGTAARIHVDLGHSVGDEDVLVGLRRRAETVFLSTSSELFRGRWKGSVEAMVGALVPRFTDRLIFKESRGGARLFYSDCSRDSLECGAHLGLTRHSVGVGDCFDSAWVASVDTGDDAYRLALASLAAECYASTWDDGQFAKRIEGIRRCEQNIVVGLQGVRVPWEERPSFQVYIAAPDFPHVERAPLEALVASLAYHNFRSRRPVQENGIAGPDAGDREHRRLFAADMKVMGECSLVVAVLLYDDPGTLIEIGLAARAGKPVIVYDPYNQARNVMLRCVPKLVSSDLSEILSAVFESVSTLRRTTDA